MKSWSIVIAEQGFAAFVDDILESPEYFERFGIDGIPDQVNRILPGSFLAKYDLLDRGFHQFQISQNTQEIPRCHQQKLQIPVRQ